MKYVVTSQAQRLGALCCQFLLSLRVECLKLEKAFKINGNKRLQICEKSYPTVRRDNRQWLILLNPVGSRIPRQGKRLRGLDDCGIAIIANILYRL